MPLFQNKPFQQEDPADTIANCLIFFFLASNICSDRTVSTAEKEKYVN